MPDYGVVPEGFNRKPLSKILEELEAAMMTEFGPQVIQTSQSPLGQINGTMASLVSQLYEVAGDVYQSNDVDQAEGTRLDTLAKLRLLGRVVGESEPQYRNAISNQNRARIDLQDIAREVADLPGVTYVRVFVNETTQEDLNKLPRNSVTVAVIGGDDDEIAAVIRRFIVPGVSTYGNVNISAVLDGYCRTLQILRPIEVPVEVLIKVRVQNDNMGCPPPSLIALRNALVDQLTSGTRMLINGDDITAFRLRSVMESMWPNVEFVWFNSWRDEERITSGVNGVLPIGFIEIARLTRENTRVELFE